VQAAKQAVYSKLSGDATLLALLPNGAGSITYARPTTAPEPTLPLVTYLEVSSIFEPEIPLWTTRIQVSVFAKSADQADIIGARVKALLHQGQLTIPNSGRLDSIYLDSEQEFYEEDTLLHHRAMDFRVRIYGPIDL